MDFNSEQKPTVVGLYGIQGCGKTHTLGKLKQELGEEHFAFYDGSKVLASVVESMEAFCNMTDDQQKLYRGLAIKEIAKNAMQSGKIAIVAGHFMLPSWKNDSLKSFDNISTPEDLDTYTHIIYLDVCPKKIHGRRSKDNHNQTRIRKVLTLEQLNEWQEMDRDELRKVCRKHEILFTQLSRDLEDPFTQTAALLRDFQRHNKIYNLSLARRKLDELLVTSGKEHLETAVVFDGDKTLAEQDTGLLFWEEALDSGRAPNPLRELFSSPRGYSYENFRQATLMYEEKNEEHFERICKAVAEKVQVHEQFRSLLEQLVQAKNVYPVIITCGVRRIWEIVLENLCKNNGRVLPTPANLSDVKVIGGGRIADGFVVTDEVKSDLVTRLKETYNLYVWAFGDSPLDVPMLKSADQGIVVVGDESTRSKSMDQALETAIKCGLRARQVLLPSTASPRLNSLDNEKFSLLPVVELDDKLIKSITSHRGQRGSCQQVFHATGEQKAKLLMTPMRDAGNSGPRLRAAHQQVGWWLAIEYLPVILGIEEYEIQHVQERVTNGYRLREESKITIVPLMRGGEPMAFGCSEALPLATFVHAKNPEDLKVNHIQEQSAIILVDSVVNSGKSVVEFVNHIRKLSRAIRIVVLAGVVQAGSISNGKLAELLHNDKLLSIVALRLSGNKFTGKGTTDTGNRLFNTTHLD